MILLKPVFRRDGYYALNVRSQRTVGEGFTTEGDCRRAIALVGLLTRQGPPLETVMMAEGYSRSLENNQWTAIDQRVAAGFCPTCAGPTVYQGYRKNGSYRAFSVCTDCGAYQEF